MTATSTEDKREYLPIVGLADFNKLSAKLILGGDSFHWILLVVDAHGEKVYVLDPLRHPRHFTEWRKIMEMALKIFRHSIGKREENFDWKVVTCPQQPDGSQCGYYVMCYMKNIIEGIPLTYMFNEEMYRRRNIDEVRIEWFEFLQSYIDIMG